MGTVVPAGRTQLVEANSSLYGPFNPVNVAEPDTTVKPAYDPVTDVVVTTPVALTGIFAMVICLVILQCRLNSP